jgi:membrane protein implicated in regulation of membrane protease activity
MESLIEYFNGTGLMTTLWYIAVPSTIIFVLTMLGTFFGFGDDIDTDIDVDVDVDTDIDDVDDVGGGFPIFTFKNFLTFFTFFSWGGITSLNGGASPGWSVFIGLISGIVMVGIMMLMMWGFNKLRVDNTGKLSDTIGTKGTIHNTIPENGKGKVNVIIKGAYRTEDAISKNGVEIKTGSQVEVVDVAGTELIVEQVN